MWTFRIVSSAILVGCSAQADTHFLETWGFSPEDVRLIDSGKPQGRLEKSKEQGEVAIVGAVRLSISKEKFLAWYRNVDNYRTSKVVMEVGRVGNPPTIDDVRRLKLESADLKAISHCRPGRCTLKLMPPEMQEFQQQIQDSTSPDYDVKALSIVRRLFVDYVDQYLTHGTSALGVYHDKGPPIDHAEVFRSLLRDSPKLKSTFPEAYSRLERYPGSRTSSNDEFVYWSKENYGYGFKPIVNLFHVTIIRPNPKVVLICSGLLRSSHYFDGSLAITALVDDKDGSYMIYSNRSRIDLLRGMMAGWKRQIFESKAPGEIRNQLSLLKRTVEEAAIVGQ